MADPTTHVGSVINASSGGPRAVGSSLAIFAEAAPLLATAPNPHDGATGVVTSATLSWTSGSYATSRDVYFGTVTPGTFQGNQASTTYDPGTLSPATIYYWRIDEKNGSFTTTGAVWSFKTASVPRADFDGDGDVDQTDFGHLQNCFFVDISVPTSSGCEDADLTGSGNVDSADFTTFLPCFGGANRPPGC
jgi:hypothetical protein